MLASWPKYFHHPDNRFGETLALPSSCSFLRYGSIRILPSWFSLRSAAVISSELFSAKDDFAFVFRVSGMKCIIHKEFK